MVQVSLACYGNSHASKYVAYDLVSSYANLQECLPCRKRRRGLLISALTAFA
jgi:hypothetical protein